MRLPRPRHGWCCSTFRQPSQPCVHATSRTVGFMGSMIEPHPLCNGCQSLAIGTMVTASREPRVRIVAETDWRRHLTASDLVELAGAALSRQQVTLHRAESPLNQLVLLDRPIHGRHTRRLEAGPLRNGTNLVRLRRPVTGAEEAGERSARCGRWGSRRHRTCGLSPHHDTPNVAVRSRHPCLPMVRIDRGRSLLPRRHRRVRPLKRENPRAAPSRCLVRPSRASMVTVKQPSV